MPPPFVLVLRRTLLLLALTCAWSSVASAEETTDTIAERLRVNLRGLADGWFQQADLPRAEKAYRLVIEGDTLDSEARIGLAAVYVEQTRPDEALMQLALATASSNASRARVQTLRAKAFLLLGRNDAALAAVRTGLRHDPFDAQLVEVAAQVAFRRGDMPRSTLLYQRAAALDPSLESANMRLGSGFGPVLSDTPWRRAGQHALFRQAVAAWRRGALDDARRRFGDLVLRWPDNFKYRLGLGLTIRQQRLEANAGVNTPARYGLLPAPRVPGITRFIPQWKTLSDEARHVCRVTIVPARGYLSRLIERKARHDILSMDALLTEAPERSAYDRTSDGRRWRQLRGVGGREAATGVDKLRIAALFGFNTFAHEFAHQILRYAFTNEQFLQIQSLYLNALEHGRCLDYYAATNVDEYFAQGYEAYLSLRKNGRLRETGRHTRSELRRRDPPLHDFLARTFDWSHETEAALRPFWDLDHGKR